MTQPEQTNAIDPRKADAMRLAKLRQQLYTDANTRQNALATFLLSKAATAGELRRALDVRSMAGPLNNRIDSAELDAYLSQLEFEICSSFREQFGRELFDGPPVYSNVDSELRPMPADHQAALLRAASHHAKNAQPVPGWPVVIYIPTVDEDNGYLCAIKKSHPLKLGDVIEGKPVIAVAWRHTPERSDQPVYQLKGDVDWRYFVTAPITRPAAAESMTQPPADGGE